MVPGLPTNGLPFDLEGYASLLGSLESFSNDDVDSPPPPPQATHADTFLPAVGMEQGAEHQLEFHACFEEYLEHFEGKIKRFIESTGEGKKPLRAKRRAENIVICGCSLLQTRQLRC